MPDGHCTWSRTSSLCWFPTAAASLHAASCPPPAAFNPQYEAKNNLWPLPLSLLQVVGYLLVRLAVLPPLMAVLAWACGLDAQRQLVLVVLAACPLAQLGFAVSEKYGRGAETASAVIVFGVLLMLPHIIGVLQALAALGIAHL